MVDTSVRVSAGRSLTNSIDGLIAHVMWNEITGAYAVRKFGERLSVGTAEEDLWNGPDNKETLLTTGVTHYLSCTDNTNGVGQRMRVEGLDENWEVQYGYGILTGQTQAAIVKDDGSAALWTRISRAFQVSAVPDPVGDVYIAESDTLTAGVPDTSAKVHGYLDFATDAAHQTEKAMYTVPAAHVGLILDITGGIEHSGGSTRAADFFLEVQELAFDATASSPAWAPFRRVQEMDVNSGATVWNQEYFHVPFIVGPLTNIHLRAAASASSDLIGSFEVIVIPEEYEPGHEVFA